MADDTIIKINPSFSSEIEFEVKIDGIDNSKPEVRFVVVSKSDSCNYSIVCSKVKSKTVMWMAKIPVLKHMTDKTCPFFVEVLVDGFYFKPAEGILHIVQGPTVKIHSSLQTNEAVAVTRQLVAPGEQLDVEEPLLQSKVKTGEIGTVGKNDKLVDRSRLSDIGDVTVPGDSDREPQPGAERPDDEPINDLPLGSDLDIDPEDFEAVLAYANAVADNSDHPLGEFDPRKVAESIIKSTVGVREKPTTQGTMFKRDHQGRPVVQGLDSPDQAAIRAANAEKVRQILTR